MEGTQPPDYRERLTPPLWAFVAAAVLAPMAALVFAPLNATVALIAGAVVAIGVIALLVLLSPIIEVRDGWLRAGRARIDTRYLGAPVEYRGEEARLARGQRLDPRSWHLIRGGIEGLVVVPLEDPDDPVPSWAISSRTPDRLRSALRAASVRQRTPGR
jgi:hypothetical protein